MALLQEQRTDKAMELHEKLSSGSWTQLSEIIAPLHDDWGEDGRFQTARREMNQLIGDGLIDGATISDFPRFSVAASRLATGTKRLLARLSIHLPLLFDNRPTEWVRTALNEVHAHRPPHNEPALDSYFVTVAAQRHTIKTIRERIQLGVNEQQAVAIFAPSGGDPIAKEIRRLNRLLSKTPIPQIPLNSALETADAVSDLKASGEIQEDILVCGVWDPMKEPVMSLDGPLPDHAFGRLKDKLERGMTSFHTNPIFSPIRFNNAVRRLEEVGLRSQMKLNLGLTYITTPKNLQHWFLLAGVSFRDPEAQEMYRELSDIHSSSTGKERTAMIYGWNKERMTRDILAIRPDGIRFTTPVSRGYWALFDALQEVYKQGRLPIPEPREPQSIEK